MPNIQWASRVVISFVETFVETFVVPCVLPDRPFDATRNTLPIQHSRSRNQPGRFVVIPFTPASRSFLALAGESTVHT
jgi:hypothetical protein